MLLLFFLYKFYYINTLENININFIKYELFYNNFTTVKVIISTHEEIKDNIEFDAFLNSENKNIQLLLKCSNINLFIIECISFTKQIIDYQLKYYFYYNCMNNCNLIINKKKTFEDNNRISFIFKPYIQKNQILYNNKKTIKIKKNNNMVNNGYLFICRKSKKLLKNPKDGFNKYIEFNNYISSYNNLNDYRPLSSYKEAIIRGFHMVDADILFTKDKIPIICHSLELEKFSNGSGIITSKTLNELEQLVFFNDKYKNEKILTFEELLKLCKDNNIIIDLDLYHVDFDYYFNKTDDYAKIIIDTVKKYDMFNSIIFNNGNNLQKLTKLKKFKKDISISISNMNERRNIEVIKDKYNDSKRIIYNMGNLLYGKTIKKETVKYGLSLGKKIKAAKVNDPNFAETLFLWGVNYITTQQLEPFQLKNEKEEPIRIECNSNSGKYSECEIDENILLNDNEIYNIYYSDNIYNLFGSINEMPIGIFKYINTNINEKLYYSVRYLNFQKGIIKLILSSKVEKGIILKGIIGPDYDNVAKCYLYNFYCEGNNSIYIYCNILKNEKNKIKFKGNYKVYYLENYSLNDEKIKKRINQLLYISDLSILLITFIIKIYNKFF